MIYNIESDDIREEIIRCFKEVQAAETDNCFTAAATLAYWQLNYLFEMVRGEKVEEVAK